MLNKKLKTYYDLTLLIMDPDDPTKTIEYHPKTLISGVLLKAGGAQTLEDHYKDKTSMLHITEDEAYLLKNDPLHGGIVKLDERGFVPSEFVDPVTIALYFEYETFTDLLNNNIFHEGDYGRLALVRNPIDDQRVKHPEAMSWIIYRLIDDTNPHEVDSFQIILQKHDVDHPIYWDSIEDRPRSDILDIDEAVRFRHRHPDKVALDGLRETEDGDILYKGKRIIKRSEFQAVITTTDRDAPNIFVDDLVLLLVHTKEHEAIDEDTVEHIAPFTVLEGNVDRMYMGNTDLVEGPKIKTARVTSAKEFFKNCTNLKSYAWYDTRNCTDLTGFHQGCTSLKYIPNCSMESALYINFYLSQTGVERVEDIAAPVATKTRMVLSDCSDLLYVANILTPVSTDHTGFCKNDINLETFGTIYALNSLTMEDFFYNCKKLRSVGRITSPKCENMANMFYGCELLPSVVIDLSHCENTTSMFEGCTNLQFADITGLKTDISFEGTKLQVESLRTILSKRNTSVNKTIVITGTPCVSQLTDDDDLIIYQSGWTVVR